MSRGKEAALEQERERLKTEHSMEVDICFKITNSNTNISFFVFAFVDDIIDIIHKQLSLNILYKVARELSRAEEQWSRRLKEVEEEGR